MASTVAPRSVAPWRAQVRWSRWLAVGTLVGLVLGFAVGLARPRTRR